VHGARPSARRRRVALALLAIRSGIGARVTLDAAWPTAALFGERTGRVILAAPAASVSAVREALSDAGVPGTRIGVAGGDALELRFGGSSVSVGVIQLAGAWRTPF
jgi:phosphoribosylformylglycinamidine (FGAM) synthase-like enzyme